MIKISKDNYFHWYETFWNDIKNKSIRMYTKRIISYDYRDI